MPFESDTVAILALPLADFDALRNQLSNRRVQILLIIQLLLACIQFGFTLFSNALVQHFSNSFHLTTSAFVSALHLAVSMLHFVIGFYLHRSYYWKLRLIGFHTHYQRTVKLLNFVERINHYCSVLLLTIWTGFSFYDQNQTNSQSNQESNQSMISITAICLCLALVFAFILKLLFIELKFKAVHNLPDVYEIENPEIPGRNLPENDIGIRQTSYVEDLLFKQSELIENLKLQNWHLRDSLFKINRANESPNDC